MSASTSFQQKRDLVMYDDQFQAACQHYAHGNGSSAAIAAAAVKVLEAAHDRRAAMNDLLAMDGEEITAECRA